MNELSDRLSALADDATRGVELVPPHLCLAVRRRRRRRRTQFGLVALVVGAVVVVMILLPVRHHAVQVTIPPSPSGALSATPPLSQISSVALAQAKTTGDSFPQGGEVVVTKSQGAMGLLGQSSAAGAAETHVYLVVLRGHFRCGPACFGVSSSAPTGNTLILMLDQSLHVTGFGVSNQVPDLTPLGTVYKLPTLP